MKLSSASWIFFLQAIDFLQQGCLNATFGKPSLQMYLYSKDPISSSYGQNFLDNFLANFPKVLATLWQDSWTITPMKNVANSLSDICQRHANTFLQYYYILVWFHSEIVTQGMLDNFNRMPQDRWFRVQRNAFCRNYKEKKLYSC
jgi:hypothetical protein